MEKPPAKVSIYKTKATEARTQAKSQSKPFCCLAGSVPSLPEEPFIQPVQWDYRQPKTHFFPQAYSLLRGGPPSTKK